MGDTVNLLGSVVTIDGVNVLSANNSGSVQGVEPKRLRDNKNEYREKLLR